MTKKKVGKNIFLLTFDSSQEAARNLLRFQEHYESPKFRNKIFSLDEFKKWYTKYRKETEFTYYTDWTGFNFPSYVFMPFYSGAFRNLTIEENRVLNLFRNETGPYYIIGISKGDKKTLKHELMHGLFYTNQKYQHKALEIIGSHKDVETLDTIRSYLSRLGYHADVIEDELHAYIATEFDRLEEVVDVRTLTHLRYLLDLNYNWFK